VQRKTHVWSLLFLAVVLFVSPGGRFVAQEARHKLPDHIPPKRSSQITDGFGINSDLPREPYLPWERWWWGRMFDAGAKWIRIGQYENSSDLTSWDYVEQKRGVLAIAPKLDEYVNSLLDNGIHIQVQLMYGNPMYTSPSGKLPDSIVPMPGSFHNDDRSLYSVFWPPRTPEQIEAFTRYVRFMVNHFKGRIHYWALWNEEDIGYWNPWGNPEEYGRLLRAFVKAVHETDEEAKVIYGGQADPNRDFARRALDACDCAPGIDIFAYHTYPGYGQNLNPESEDYGAYGTESPAKLRDLVRHYPGIRSDIPFWDDEFNSIPSWQGSDESVQAKYIPRMLVYNWAAGVKTFVWIIASATDGNEYDDFGLIHGVRNLPEDFTPRPGFFSLQNANALFSDTALDSTIKIEGPGIPALRRNSGFPFFAYGFRGRNGKAIVAYWLGAHSLPGNVLAPFYESLTLENTGIEHPALIDVVSGEIRPLEWEKGTTNVLASVPVRDSVLAIADTSYFDWNVLPEAPSGLRAEPETEGLRLTWEVHGGNPAQIALERRIGEEGWQKIKTLPATATEFVDSLCGNGALASYSQSDCAGLISYRVRALNDAGESAYSNVVRVK
jgi:hypothetical protein